LTALIALHAKLNLDINLLIQFFHDKVLSNVQSDIRILGIKRWMYKAQDRQEWARITREAKVKLKGP
jgi:hypothetical protein